jgi:hypothetical protein
MSAALQAHYGYDLGHAIEGLVGVLAPHVGHMTDTPSRHVTVIKPDGKRVHTVYFELGVKFCLTTHGLMRIQRLGTSGIFSHHGICELDEELKQFLRQSLEDLWDKDERIFGHSFSH